MKNSNFTVTTVYRICAVKSISMKLKWTRKGQAYIAKPLNSEKLAGYASHSLHFASLHSYNLNRFSSSYSYGSFDCCCSVQEVISRFWTHNLGIYKLTMQVTNENCPCYCTVLHWMHSSHMFLKANTRSFHSIIVMLPLFSITFFQAKISRVLNKNRTVQKVDESVCNNR